MNYLGALGAEGPEDLAGAHQALISARGWYETLEPLPAPLPGSMLAIEDTHTARVPLSTQVRSAWARAYDALGGFVDMSTVADGMYVARPFAHHALIRMACEATALGLWLLRPERKFRRVYRSLCLEYTHAGDVLGLSRTLTGAATHNTDEHDEIVVRLNELMNTVSQLRETKLQAIPRWSDILRDISPTVPAGAGHGADSPLVIWKTSSAFLHGSETTVRLLSEIEMLTPYEGDLKLASAQLRPSWRLLASYYQMCVELLLDLSIRYLTLGTTDYSGKDLSEQK
ncbi:hypothetical protein [Microbacterium gorillae]|uniref:hypothetical protein n=1 Tax=Microbacterium gorillae TaxID=1231063 RepID=UPI003D988D89